MGLAETVQALRRRSGTGKMAFFGRMRDLWKECDGAVTMEYVLLCVMLAAASVMMVIAFSRSVARQFALVSYAMSGYPQEQLSEGLEQFRQAEKDDKVVGEVFSDYMHGEKVERLGN